MPSNMRLETFLPLQDKPILGLDVGEKTLGVALSDRTCLIASPFLFIQRTSFRKDAARLLEHAQREDIYGFIIGLPINMNGQEGVSCQRVRTFAHNLARLTNLPIAFWDERGSTIAAERVLLMADLSRRKRKDRLDKTAATYILQGALDYFRYRYEC